MAREPARVGVVGVDVTLAVQRTLCSQAPGPEDVPAPTLKPPVRAGCLARRTGRAVRDRRR